MLSSQSKLPGPGDEAWQDFIWFKTAHVLAYAFLTRLVWFGMSVWVEKPQRWKATFFTVLFLAIIDELHQSTVPGRHPRMTDILIDMSGSTAVLFLLERYNALDTFPREWKKLFGM